MFSYFDELLHPCINFVVICLGVFHCVIENTLLYRASVNITAVKIAEHFCFVLFVSFLFCFAFFCSLFCVGIVVWHTDFITVVDERRTWHGKKESESNFQLIPLQTACQTVHIMVSGRDADQAFLCGLIVVGFVGLYKLRDISFSAFGEEWLIAAEQIVVMGRSKVKQEVHVEAAL